jgi:hypothetical protein
VVGDDVGGQTTSALECTSSIAPSSLRGAQVHAGEPLGSRCNDRSRADQTVSIPLATNDVPRRSAGPLANPPGLDHLSLRSLTLMACIGGCRGGCCDSTASGLMAPGVWTTYGRQFARRIAECLGPATRPPTIWDGKMEGALLSADRAVREVVDDLVGPLAPR